MDYAFFCDRCGAQLEGNEKKLWLTCEQCGSTMSEDEFYRQLDKLRDQDFCEQFRSKSRQERGNFWKGIRKEEADTEPLLIPAPVEEDEVPQWAGYMAGILGNYTGTEKEEYFHRLGIDIHNKECGEHLYEMFFGRAGGGGDILFFINTLLDSFDYWERLNYSDITRLLSRMYGQDCGLHANGMIHMGLRTVLGEREPEPTLDLFLESFRFYESGKDHLDWGERQYSTSFKQGTTRFVNFELGLCNHLHEKDDRTYHVIYRCYSPDGTMQWEQEYILLIISEDNSPYYSEGFGWDQPGQWKLGTYRVVILFDGVIFAQRPFTIEA
jgi:hypothetical protein